MPSSADLGTALDQIFGAISSGNTQAAQEAIREFNLSYNNSTAEQFGQSYGPGNAAPTGASTLASGQATGGIGYIPGFSGTNVGQTQSELSTQAGTAQAAAGLTGFYAAPAQSQWSPGTFLRLDPSTYDTNQYGQVQLDYVLPSGQLQRVNIPQATAMGWNGNLGQMSMVDTPTALRLESAPPSNVPQQTLEGQTTYSNLNTAAQNQALAAAGATGYYTAPATITPPGTNMMGGKFSDVPAATQQAYFQAHGGDWQSAMNAWVADSNAAIQQWAQANGVQIPGQQAGQPIETQAAQQQYFQQAQDLATMYGQYYTPGTPGQAGAAGVNMPQQGQTTLAAQQQAYSQQLGAINAAAALQANPFRQQQVIGQLGNLLNGNPVPGFSSPNTVAGVGTAGGTGTNTGMAYMQQMIDDIRSGPNSANTQSMQDVLNGIPTPNKINSVDFMRSAPSTQNMVLQGMQEKYGLDPQDSMAQIKNTLPAFQAPTTFGSIKG